MTLRVAVTEDALTNLVRRQIASLFFPLNPDEAAALSAATPEALGRVEKCFSFSKNKYYKKENDIYFNPLQSSQYCIFLYFLSNSIYLKNGASNLADQVYYLNKALNGADLFYEVALPDVFFLDHPVGSVIGRARFGNGFRFAQNCTIGNNKGVYPTLGRNVVMHAGATIIGDCTVGDNAVISAHTLVKDENVPRDTLVFGSSPNLVFRPADPAYLAALPDFGDQ